MTKNFIHFLSKSNNKEETNNSSQLNKQNTTEYWLLLTLGKTRLLCGKSLLMLVLHKCEPQIL